MAKRGSKLVKSEALQVRFDPLLRWAVEIRRGGNGARCRRLSSGRQNAPRRNDR